MIQIVIEIVIALVALLSYWQIRTRINRAGRRVQTRETTQGLEIWIHDGISRERVGVVPWPDVSYAFTSNYIEFYLRTEKNKFLARHGNYPTVEFEETASGIRVYLKSRDRMSSYYAGHIPFNQISRCATKPNNNKIKYKLQHLAHSRLHADHRSHGDRKEFQTNEHGLSSRSRREQCDISIITGRKRKSS